MRTDDQNWDARLAALLAGLDEADDVDERHEDDRLPLPALTSAGVAALSVYNPIQTPLTWSYAALGTGKTRAELHEIASILIDENGVRSMRPEDRTKFAILAPTLVLARQIVGELQDAIRQVAFDRGVAESTLEVLLGYDLLLYEGWAAKEEVHGEERHICKFGEQMEMLQKSGRACDQLCERKIKKNPDDAAGEVFRCQFIDDCRIALAHMRPTQPRVVVTSHAFLPLGFGAARNWRFNYVVIDETFIGTLVPRVDVALCTVKEALIDVDRVADAEWQAKQAAAEKSAAMKKKLVTKTREAAPPPPREARAAERAVQARALSDPWVKLKAAVVAASERQSRALSVHDLPPPEAIAELRDFVVEDQNARRHSLPPAIRPNPTGNAVETISQLRALPHQQAVEFLNALLCALHGAVDDAGHLCGVYVEQIGNDCRLVGHQRLPLDAGVAGADTIKVFSSTLEPETLVSWFEEVVQSGEWTYPQPDPMERIHVLAGMTTKSLIVEPDAGEPWLTDTGEKIVEVIDDMRLRAAVEAPGKGVLVSGIKLVMRAMGRKLDELAADGRPRAPVDLDTFDSRLGRNAFADWYGFVSVGRQLPSYRRVKTLLEALAGRKVDPPPTKGDASGVGPWQEEVVEKATKHGEVYECVRPWHPDHVVAAFLRQTAISGPVQSDRSRAFRPGRAPGLRVMFGGLATPEVFDRVEHQIGQALDAGVIAEIARRHGITLSYRPNGRGHWAILGLLLGLSPEAAKKRIGRERGAGAIVGQVDAALARFTGRQLMEVRIAQPGQREVVYEVFVEVDADEAHPEAAARRRFDEAMTEIGVPEGVEVSRVARRMFYGREDGDAYAEAA